jgi:hypothetical protein
MEKLRPTVLPPDEGEGQSFSALLYSIFMVSIFHKKLKGDPPKRFGVDEKGE